MILIITQSIVNLSFCLLLHFYIFLLEIDVSFWFKSNIVIKLNHFHNISSPPLCTNVILIILQVSQRIIYLYFITLT